VPRRPKDAEALWLLAQPTSMRIRPAHNRRFASRLPVRAYRDKNQRFAVLGPAHEFADQFLRCVGTHTTRTLSTPCDDLGSSHNLG